jgi:hypothetical protein
VSATRPVAWRLRRVSGKGEEEADDGKGGGGRGGGGVPPSAAGKAGGGSVFFAGDEDKWSLDAHRIAWWNAIDTRAIAEYNPTLPDHVLHCPSECHNVLHENGMRFPGDAFLCFHVELLSEPLWDFFGDLGW